MIVNFDNAATTFPKPPEVRRALNEAILRYGGNAGRASDGVHGRVVLSP